MTQVKIKRVYETPDTNDGYRVLVDRLWPRGMKKETLKYDVWEKGVSPSTQLRKWYHADRSGRWEEFATAYLKELEQSRSFYQFLESIRRYDNVTLLYSSRETEHNHARILQQFLERKLHEEREEITA